MKDINIFLLLVKQNLKKMLEYRGLFFAELFTMVLWSLAYIFFIEVIYLHTNTMAGWTKSQALFILAFYYSFQTFAEIFFIDNFENFSMRLRRGTLDFDLLKPVSSRLLIFLRDMRFQDLSHFVITAILFSYAIANLPQPLNPGWFLVGLLMVLPAVVLNFCIHSIGATAAFWIEKNDAIGRLLWNFRQTAKYPRQVYKSFFYYVFSFMIPFALLAAVPAEVAMEFPNFPFPFILLGFTVIFYFFSRWFWNQGLKKYSSAN